MVARGSPPPAVCYRRPVPSRSARRAAAAALFLAALASGSPASPGGAPGWRAGGEAEAGVAPGAPLVGFTVHWDFFSSASECDRLVAFAIANGARILNVVPPPHIWEDPASLAILRGIFSAASAHGVGVVLNRIDGSALPDAAGERRNWLYTHVLTERGRLPSGRPTPGFFLATVGRPEYERWLREETAYYAEAFSGESALLAFGVGLFNEPFVSQRGSLLCWDPATETYEIAQYTPYAAALWRRWLAARYGGIAGVNARYGTRFPAVEAVPMPVSDADPAFADARRAYFDLVSAINDWVVRGLEECRALWRARARRPVPFMLQFSGYVPEKLAKGRAAFAALDVADWMTRADALGLSVYTDCEYPDLGRSSVVAMVNALRLGPLLGKPVYVLEGGNECHGAVLDRRGLRFFATAATPLRPASVIYEFLGVSYAEQSRTSAGKLLSAAGAPRPAAIRAVREALAAARTPAPPGPTTWVLDDLAGLPDDDELLAARLDLARRAVEQPLTFVPPQAVPSLPPGSVLVVPSRAQDAAWRRRLAARGIVAAGPDGLPRIP